MRDNNNIIQILQNKSSPFPWKIRKNQANLFFCVLLPVIFAPHGGVTAFAYAFVPITNEGQPGWKNSYISRPI